MRILTEAEFQRTFRDWRDDEIDKLRAEGIAKDKQLKAQRLVSDAIIDKLRDEVERLKGMEVSERQRIVRITATHCAEVCNDLGKTSIDYFNANVFANAIRKEYGLE